MRIPARFVSITLGLLLASGVCEAQRSWHSSAVAGAVHTGTFGGATTSGFGVSGIVSLRVLPIAAVRGDVSYTRNTSGENAICVLDPCQQGGLSEVIAWGFSGVLGNLVGASTRAYAVGGVERLFTGGADVWSGRSVVVPKIGAGVLFSGSAFVELTGRWRENWDGWRVRHWVLLVGRYW